MARWTTIDHEVRDKFGLTLNQYAIADSIYALSRGGWCSASREYLGAFIGISKRSAIEIVKHLVSLNLIEKRKNNELRTTQIWDAEIEKTKINPDFKGEESSPQPSENGEETSPQGEESSLENSQNGEETSPQGEESSPNNNSIITNNDNNNIDTDAWRLTQLLYDLIMQYVNPPTWKNKSPKLENWYHDIEKLHRLDGQSYIDIERIIRWVVHDNFWSQNVLSGAKLRKHYNHLYFNSRKTRTQNNVVDIEGNRKLVEEIRAGMEAQK